MKKISKGNKKFSEFDDNAGGGAALQEPPETPAPDATGGDEFGEEGAESGEAGDSESAPEPQAASLPNTHWPVVDTAELKLSDIVIDAKTQPRVAISDETVKEYAEVVKQAMLAGQPIPFPAVTVFRDVTGRCVLADGFHRYGAHKEAGAEKIEAEIHEGTEEDALLFSLSANSTHGNRRTNKDKQRAVNLALAHPEWKKLSDAQIARLCEVSAPMVANLRPAHETPTERVAVRKGKTVKMDVSGIGKGKEGKSKKAAAKATKEAKKTGKAEPAKVTEDNAVKLDKALGKIADATGAEGGKFRKAVLEGAISHLNLKDVEELSEFAPEKQKQVLPLVAGGPRMKPAKAFDLIGSELSAKICDELHNRAIAGHGKFEYETDSLHITVKVKKAAKAEAK